MFFNRVYFGAGVTLRKKVEEIKKRHGITEAEMIARLPKPLSFRKDVTEWQVVNFLDLIYG